MDVFFLADIILTFFKKKEGKNTIRLISYDYIFGALVFDLVACLPSLITLEQFLVYYLKLFRFVHWNRLFKQINLIIDKVLSVISGGNYNKQKVRDITDLIK
jgi:hypothetical protein